MTLNGPNTRLNLWHAADEWERVAKLEERPSFT